MKKLIIILVVGIAILFAILPFNYLPDFEERKCPFCYGQDFCNNKNLTLRTSSLSDFINNVLSVKNVYFTNENIVLKKLAHNKNLNLLDLEICNQHKNTKNCELSSLNLSKLNYKSLLFKSLGSKDKGYRICGENSIDIVLKRLLENKSNLINLWTLSLISFEGLFYKVFGKSNFSLPMYHGACGRVIAVENCGKPLNDFEEHNWITRAMIARSIIELFSRFSEGDGDFRIYFTDISPDNIAVDVLTLNVKFVDFGNVILTQKTNLSMVHKSEDFSSENGFVYLEEDICRSSISDHNIYSICKLLFSQNSPWPMMNGGLLHSTPKEIQSEHQILQNLIETCIQGSNQNRFDTIRMIDDKLKEILNIQTTM